MSAWGAAADWSPPTSPPDPDEPDLTCGLCDGAGVLVLDAAVTTCPSCDGAGEREPTRRRTDER